MKNKVIIDNNSGLKPEKKSRALEILSYAPFDFLAEIDNESGLRSYPKLYLTSTPNGGISWSSLKFCLEAPFYKIICEPDNFKVKNYTNHLIKKSPLDFWIYRDNRKASEFYYNLTQDSACFALYVPNQFCFELKISPNQLLGPNGQILFPSNE